MIKIFNKSNRTFEFVNQDRTAKKKVGPGSFAEITDDFTGDITFRVALACGEIEQYNTIREADQLERAAKDPEPVEEPAAVTDPVDQPEAAPKGRGKKA